MPQPQPSDTAPDSPQSLRPGFAPLCVAAGAAAGAGTRATLVALLGTAHPASEITIILAINLCGALLRGTVSTFFVRPTSRNLLVSLGLGTGFLGGFTTYSTFALDAVSGYGTVPTSALIAVVAATIVFGPPLAMLGGFLGGAARKYIGHGEI